MTNDEIDAVREYALNASRDRAVAPFHQRNIARALAAIDHLTKRVEKAERERDENKRIIIVDESRLDDLEQNLRAQLAAAQAEVARLRTERGCTAERYWEARYRDEAAQLAARDAAIAESLRRADATGSMIAHHFTEPLRQFQQPEPDKLVCPYAGEVWSYKGNRYRIVSVDGHRRIQFEDAWHTAVEYTEDNDVGLLFYRALPDFLAKFARGGRVVFDGEGE